MTAGECLGRRVPGGRGNSTFLTSQLVLGRQDLGTATPARPPASRVTQEGALSSREVAQMEPFLCLVMGCQSQCTPSQSFSWGCGCWGSPELSVQSWASLPNIGTQPHTSPLCGPHASHSNANNNDGTQWPRSKSSRVLLNPWSHLTPVISAPPSVKGTCLSHMGKGLWQDWRDGLSELTATKLQKKSPLCWHKNESP